MRNHPGPGRVKAAYPRVRVWWNGKFWSVVPFKDPIHMAGPPIEFSNHGRALRHAVGVAERLSRIHALGLGQRSMFSGW